MGSAPTASTSAGSGSIAITVICPVCEHAQERGAECDACGARLGAVTPAVEVPTATLPDLETTAISSSPMAATVAPSEANADGWLERTASAAVGVTVEPLEVERVAPGSRDRSPASPLTCRYCRTPATTGQQFCERCGMRLRSYRPPGAGR